MRFLLFTGPLERSSMHFVDLFSDFRSPTHFVFIVRLPFSLSSSSSSSSSCTSSSFFESPYFYHFRPFSFDHFPSFDARSNQQQQLNSHRIIFPQSGQRCAKDDCTVRVHKHCAKKIFKAGTQRKCPTCKTPWNVSAEDEASATQNSSTQNVSSTQNASADSTQQQQPSTSSGRRGRSTSGRS